MRYQGVSPQHDGTEQRTVCKGKTGCKELPSDGRPKDHLWQPEVHLDEEVAEVAEVKQEEVIAQLLIGIPSVGKQS
jgi:hypothetical protein